MMVKAGDSNYDNFANPTDYEEYKYVCDCSILDNKGKVIIAHKRQHHVFAGGCRNREISSPNTADSEINVLGGGPHCPCNGYSQKKQILNPDYRGD